ncbi:MAG: hydroxylamine reductase [Myxococcota bacterium]|nr:hydroxylamine reductase [Myxococcota bacterium]
MFCFQCQEAAKNEGCTNRGVCGKSPEVAGLQDLLLSALRGAAVLVEKAATLGVEHKDAGPLVAEALFATVTNVNFDEDSIKSRIKATLSLSDELSSLITAKAGADGCADLPSAATWRGDEATFADRAREVGVLSESNEDVRSLRELLIYGIKGIAAYAHHAAVLGKEDASIYNFLIEALASTTKTLTQEEMVALVLRAGEVAVTTMATLDAANTGTYGHPEITEVPLGVRDNPGILVSGHDLKDLEELLEQTKGTGVDVYTHGEMLPAHYYPAFKKYDHFAGHYGGAWYDQKADFESFAGPILFTTNCLVPPRESYINRVYTTGTAGYPGTTHIPDREPGQAKQFDQIVAHAKTCAPPNAIESGTIVGGFAHNQVLALADTVVEAVKSGAVKKFIVMAGCDGRQKSRSYFTDVAQALPPDTVILTAGCAKFRYNKLPLGDIGGIPRVLDAGQCNDSYSLAVVALKLKEVFGLDDINALPIEFDIAWYEQKAVAVLLALLHLGVKGIRLGPTLPAFLSPNVAKVLVDTFDIKPTGSVQEDVAAMVS